MKITIDTTDWTQHQKNMIVAIAYSLACEAGENIVPTLVWGEEECTLDFLEGTDKLIKAITGENILVRLASDDEEREQARIEYEARLQKAQEAKNANMLNLLSLCDIDDEIEGITTIEDVKGCLKSLMQYTVANRMLEE